MYIEGVTLILLSKRATVQYCNSNSEDTFCSLRRATRQSDTSSIKNENKLLCCNFATPSWEPQVRLIVPRSWGQEKKSWKSVS